MKRLLSTKEVAKFLDVNEKMVYSLVSEKGLPATKITGKWLFPRHLVEQWIETKTINYPEAVSHLPPYHGLLIIAGSNDPLLERTISLFNTHHDGHVAVFGNIGSMGGLSALKRNLCQMASSHLLQEQDGEYNFGYASAELKNVPAVVNFSRREQGIMVIKGNPKKIRSVADLGRPGMTIVNRPAATGTRLLFDHELKRAEIDGTAINGYDREVDRHIDVGLEVLSKKVDAGLGIRAVASLLGLDFIPLRWERFDLLVSKERFFDQGVQLFLGLLHEQAFRDLAAQYEGYDIRYAGKMVYPSNGSAHDDPLTAEIDESL